MSKSRRRAPRLGPNDGLDPAEFRDLNAEFYRMRPWGYFKQQIELLALLSDRSEELDSLLRGGAAFGRAPVRLIEDERAPDGEREEDRERFLIAQTEVLLHHAAETLLRLYLAHESFGPCPWLDIAGSRDFRRFKRGVRALAEDLSAGRRGDLMRVFCGSNDRAFFNGLPELTPELWEARERNISAWLGWFCLLFLDANVYNAAKHGFALNAGDSLLQIGGHGDPDPLGRDGPALHFIEEVMGDDGQRWRRTTKWVSFGVNARAVFMACRLMQAIMTIGTVVRGGARPDSLQKLDWPTPDDVLDADMPESGITFSTVHFDLSYAVDRRAPAKCRP